MMMQLTGWAIIHSLWQGGLIALVVAALLAVTRGSAPQTRYAISIVALTLMVAAPLATAFRSVRSGGSSTLLNNISADLSAPQLSEGSVVGGDAKLPSQPSSDAVIAPSPAVSPILSSSRKLGTSIKERFETAIPWVVLLWMVGLMLASIRLIGGYARTRAIRKSGLSNSANAIQLRVSEFAARLGISRIVDAIESTTVDVPLVVGAVRPLIVVPASLVTGLTPIQLDMLLAHELAHIRRHDYVVNLFQTIVETLLFYHPAVRWVSERAREERENCCDDVAIALCGVNPREYTSTLLILEEARGQRIGFATAATGGSLLRRAVRLVTGKTPRVELGPLWFAGLLTISAALLTGREAFADIRSSYVPVSYVAGGDSTKPKKKDSIRNPDPSRGAPSEVVNAPAGTLEEKWRWAERSRDGTFWIGYLVGPTDMGSRFYTSSVPVRIDGNTSMSGRMKMDNSDMSSMIFYGAPLRNLFGAHMPGSTAMFFKSVPGPGGRHVESVQLASFALSIFFDKLPVVWLDSVPDAESVPRIQSLMAQASEQETKRDLISALGAHNDERLTTPILIGLLQGRDPDGTKREAADWLGQSRDPRALTALAHAAHADPSTSVRRGAVEAIGSLHAPAAMDTLMRFVDYLDNYDARREAVEALGSRDDPRVGPYLTSLIRSNADSKIRETALEAIVQSKDAEAAPLVIDVAKKDVDSRMRRNAVELVERIMGPAQALSVLRDIVYGNDDESVRRQAVESIGRLDTEASNRTLKEIIAKSNDDRVQTEAVESIAHKLAETSDVSVLADIARNNPSERVRRQAIESIAHVASSKAGIDLLLSIARSDPVESVKRSALEELASKDDPAAKNAIASIVRGRDPLALRMRALDVYVDAANPSDAVALIKSVLSSDDAFDMRLKAVNLLEDVRDNAGIPVLRQVAQSNPDQRLRSKAAHILDDK